MNSFLRFVLGSALLLPSASLLSADALEIYSVPDGEFTHPTFEVTVNGEPVPVIQSGHRSDGSITLNDARNYAHFSFEGEVEIEVTGLSDYDYTLFPSQFGITPTVDDGERLVFNLDRPRYIILDPGSAADNRTGEALFIFADPIDPRMPNPEAPDVLAFTDYTGGSGLQGALNEVASRDELNTLYLPPGLYANSGVLDIPSNVTLYLAGGAKIDRGLIRFRNVENAHVRGRGVLEFGRSNLNDYSFGIAGVHSQNVSVHGVIARTASNWNTVIRKSSDIDILYLKVLNTVRFSQLCSCG